MTGSELMTQCELLTSLKRYHMTGLVLVFLILLHILRRPSGKREVNNKTGSTEMPWDVVACIHIAQNRDLCWAFFNTVMKFHVEKR